MLWLGANACAPLRVKTYYEPVGRLGSGQPTSTPIVDTWRDVGVYMRSAPRGFTLTDNEVAVEAGFGHRVLGFLRVTYDTGYCDLGELGQKDLIRSLQERGHTAGANAVIYVQTLWTEGTTGIGRCTGVERNPTYASGWAVVAADEGSAAAEAAAESPTPTAEPATPASGTSAAGSQPPGGEQ
jgi:hypothetical protein